MKKLQVALAALAAAGTLSLTNPVPALADNAASTRNIILGAAALAGLAIESNVAHKNAQSRTISGYLPDGSRVYADGHIVTSNGYSYYPQKNQRVACSSGSCYLANTADSNYRPNDGNSGDDARDRDHGQYGYNGQPADSRYANGRYGNGQTAGQYGNGRYDGGNDEAVRPHRDDGRS